MSSEALIQGFHALRQEQRALSAKVLELEADLTEHRLVHEALQEVAEDRTCFRMVGGVLCERTVRDVLPSLARNKELIEQLISALKKQIVEKAKEIAEYVDKNQIKIRHVDAPPGSGPAPAPEGASVLVSRDS